MVWRGIFGIQDLTKLRCGTWANAKKLNQEMGFDCNPGSGIHKYLGTECGILL